MDARLETIFREEVRLFLGKPAAPATALELVETVSVFLKTAPADERQAFAAFLRGLFEEVSQTAAAPAQATIEGLEAFRPVPVPPAPQKAPRAFRLTFPAPAPAASRVNPKPAPADDPPGDDVEDFAAAAAAR